VRCGGCPLRGRSTFQKNIKNFEASGRSVSGVFNATDGAGLIHKMKVAIKSGWQESTSLIKEMNFSLIS